MRARRIILVGVIGAVALQLWLIVLLRIFNANADRLINYGPFKRLLKTYNVTNRKTAGTPLSPHGLLTHTGRRSGRVYQTPVGATSYQDGFLVPATYGTQTDWFRNLAAAGVGTLDLKGRTFEIDRPEIVSGREALQAWPFKERIVLQLAGIQEFVWLHERRI